MHVNPRVTEAYYAQVSGAISTATNAAGQNVSYKFPCDAVLPNLYLSFGNGFVAMSARQMNFNEPDPDNCKFITLCISILLKGYGLMYLAILKFVRAP